MSDSMRAQKHHSISAQIDCVDRQMRVLRGAMPKRRPSEVELDLGILTNVSETLHWVRRNEAGIRAYVAERTGVRS